MKKLVALSVMLAVVLVITVPALGQETTNTVRDTTIGSTECVDQAAGTDVVPTVGAGQFKSTTTGPDFSCEGTGEFEQAGFESGDVKSISEVIVAGDNNAVCAPTQQPNSTGNTGEQQGFTPGVASADDVGFAGSESEENPSQLTECAPAVSQSAAS